MNHPAVGVLPFCPTLEMKKDTLLDLQPATRSNLFLDAKRLRLDAAMHVGCSKMGRNVGGIVLCCASIPCKSNRNGEKTEVSFLKPPQPAFFQTWEGSMFVSTVSMASRFSLRNSCEHQRRKLEEVRRSILRPS